MRTSLSLSLSHILTTPNTIYSPLLLLHLTSYFFFPYSFSHNTFTSSTYTLFLTFLTSFSLSTHLPYTRTILTPIANS